MEDKQKITIRFGSWDLPMTVLRKDEHLYREAETLMKERYAFYTRSYYRTLYGHVYARHCCQITTHYRKRRQHGFGG